MALASPVSLRREIEGFSVEFWDGTRLPATGGEGRPSPWALERAAFVILCRRA